MTLIDPRPEPQDEEIRRLCAQFKARPAGVRNSMSAEDFYLLLVFAQRAAVFALREGSPRWLDEGLTAIAIVDDERADTADLDASLALLFHAAKQLGAEALFARAAAIATGSVAKRIKRAASLPLQHLQTGGGFIERDRSRYEPVHDLVRVALAVRALLQQDRYRIEDMKAGIAMPPVWFSSPDAASILAGARGAAVVHARHRDEEEQALIVFLAELDGAQRLAPIPTIGGSAILTVTTESLAAVLVATSFVDDAETLETTASLQRFAEPLRAILGSA